VGAPGAPREFFGSRARGLSRRLGPLLRAHRRGRRRKQRTAHGGLLRARLPLEWPARRDGTYINGAEAEELVVREYARYRDTEINRASRKATG
jgi:hypothetical protein